MAATLRRGDIVTITERVYSGPLDRPLCEGERAITARVLEVRRTSLSLEVESCTGQHPLPPGRLIIRPPEMARAASLGHPQHVVA